MSKNDFKVNSKTKILEFKRKYNNLISNNIYDTNELVDTIQSQIDDGSIVTLKIIPLKTGTLVSGTDTEQTPNVNYAHVIFSLDEHQLMFLQTIKLLIFTMNNSFVITPLAQNGKTHCAQSFVYDSNGNSMVARLSIEVITEENYLVVKFDENFATAVVTSGITPSALLMAVK